MSLAAPHPHHGPMTKTITLMDSLGVLGVSLDLGPSWRCERLTLDAETELFLCVSPSNSGPWMRCRLCHQSVTFRGNMD